MNQSGLRRARHTDTALEPVSPLGPGRRGRGILAPTAGLGTGAAAMADGIDRCQLAGRAPAMGDGAREYEPGWEPRV